MATNHVNETESKEKSQEADKPAQMGDGVWVDSYLSD